MSNVLFTLGYTGRKPEELKAWIDGTGGLLLDVRLSPNSRVPHWRKAALETLLGDRYRHCPSLGNLNYRNGGLVAIRDMGAGLENLRRCFEERQIVFLLCACRYYCCCHRADVAMASQKAGLCKYVIHLEDDGEPVPGAAIMRDLIRYEDDGPDVWLWEDGKSILYSWADFVEGGEEVD